MTTLIGDLEKGKDLLKQLGDFLDDSSGVAKQAKELTQAMTELLVNVKQLKGDEFCDFGLFMDSFYRKYLDGSIKTEDASKVYSACKKMYEAITGNVPAIGSQFAMDQEHKCRSCGGPILPQARYCPKCGFPTAVAHFESTSEKRFCPKCDYITESKNVDGCMKCGSDLVSLATGNNELASALVESYFFMSSLAEQGNPDLSQGTLMSLANSLRVPIRKDNFIKEFEAAVQDERDFFINLACYHVAPTELKESTQLKLRRAVEKLGQDKALKFVEKMNNTTMLAFYPAIMALDEVVESNVSAIVADRLKNDAKSFTLSINEMEAWMLTLPEETQESMFMFVEGMYGMAPSIDDVNSEYTCEQAHDLAIKILGESTVKNLVNEVAKRQDLHSNVKSLQGEGFDIDRAIKAFSSCLTRTTIEQEHQGTLQLEVFRNLVFEKMQGLFEGRRAEPVSFLRGVFLDQSEW